MLDLFLPVQNKLKKKHFWFQQNEPIVIGSKHLLILYERKEVNTMTNLTAKLMTCAIASDLRVQKHENSLRSNIAEMGFWYAGTSKESRRM